MKKLRGFNRLKKAKKGKDKDGFPTGKKIISKGLLSALKEHDRQMSRPTKDNPKNKNKKEREILAATGFTRIKFRNGCLVSGMFNGTVFDGEAIKDMLKGKL